MTDHSKPLSVSRETNEGRDDVPGRTLSTTSDEAIAADGLEASRRRLEAANVSVAVFEDGSMRVIQDKQSGQAVKDGATVYSPADMLMYVTLSQHERQILRGVKGLGVKQ